MAASCAGRGELKCRDSARLWSVFFFALHKLVRMRFEFVARIRMIVQIGTQAWMIVHELLIVDQGGIFREALCDLGMLIEVCVGVDDCFVSDRLRHR